ncbi:MAG: 4Fe-4S binding protein [Chromatiaceae bacterium]|jgi:NAD-dependent dihydropyrimidine dehydrogenase PreA subunit
MHLRELLAEAVGGVPQAAPGRCVHERAGVASCRRCVTACPRDAWQLDDDELMIDTEACDGCGLCVAACPEGVLSQAGVSPDPYAGMVELSLSCERVKSGADDWRLRCVHAVGLPWVAWLYRTGLRQIGLRIGDCEACERRTDAGLTHSVARFNKVLARRGLSQIGLHTLDGDAVANDSEGRLPRQGGPALSRRGFLRRMISATAVPAVDPTEASWKPPGSHLPSAGEKGLALFVPEIDPHRCNGCDACLRVCSHAALSCERGATDAYVIAADACTGCGLCSDICDRDAISVNQDAVVSQTIIPLAAGRCKVCGIRFHKPDTGSIGDTLCQICSRVDHKRNLYQVL